MTGPSADEVRVAEVEWEDAFLTRRAAEIAYFKAAAAEQGKFYRLLDLKAAAFRASHGDVSV